MPSSAVQVCDYRSEDLPQLAEVHLEAYRGYKNAGIGRRYVREFLRYFLTSDGAIALKAEYAGQPCGYVVGIPIGRQAQLNKDLLSAYAIGALTHPWVLLRQEYRISAKAKLKRIFGRKPASSPAPTAGEPALPRRGVGLTSIAVSPRFAGKGAGSALMQAFEDRARQMHYECMRLSVYADNVRARGVYERSGWVLSSPEAQVVTYQKAFE